MKWIETHLGMVCNNDCKFCALGKKAGTQLSFDEIIKEITNISKLGANEITFVGGEPTLVKNFKEIISSAKELGFIRIEVITNGSKLNSKKYAEQIVDAGANDFIVSIHGPTAKIHDDLTTRKGSFDNAISTLCNLNEISEKQNIGVHTNTVITKSNMCHLPKMHHLFIGCGSKRIQIAFPQPLGNALTNFDEIVPNMTDAVSWIRKMLNESSYPLIPVKVEGVPLCLMRGLERCIQELGADTRQINYPHHHTISDFKKHRMDVKVKGKMCSSCNKTNICEGIWPNYAERKGLSELIPFDDPEIYSLYVEKKCNNKCIICPHSKNLNLLHAKPGTFFETTNILARIKEIKRTTDEIIITGLGEPTLQKDIFKITTAVLKKFPQSGIKMVSNGRMFYYSDFAEKTVSLGLNHYAIYLHGHSDKLHDSITQTNGSFYQTIQGIRNLTALRAKVEIMINVHGINYPYLPDIAGFILDEFPTAEVTFIFCEIDINTKNKKHPVSFRQAVPFVEKAVNLLKKEKVKTKLFNFPNCIINKDAWDLIESDPTDNSNDMHFPVQCEPCVMRGKCSGIWKNYGTSHGIKEFNPIILKKNNHNTIKEA